MQISLLLLLGLASRGITIPYVSLPDTTLSQAASATANAVPQVNDTSHDPFTGELICLSNVENQRDIQANAKLTTKEFLDNNSKTWTPNEVLNSSLSKLQIDSIHSN